ncbi:hypothetical protein GGX14DRAFT_587182 [Mycena pura]|uniref:Uncharacterized protein n=1 Tax=Mycena pura TaxID=153505 RepID=A0AAD6UXD0_9AGAR|nr:hypothetical protein GGX14DRAFT_587182 [Mycena pura]
MESRADLDELHVGVIHWPDGLPCPARSNVLQPTTRRMSPTSSYSPVMPATVPPKPPPSVSVGTSPSATFVPQSRFSALSKGKWEGCSRRSLAQRFPIATSEDLAEAGGIWLKQACSAWDVRRKGDLAVRAMATEHTQVYHFMGTDDATATLEFGQWPPTSVDWWLRRCVHGDATRPWASRRGAQFTIDTMEAGGTMAHAQVSRLRPGPGPAGGARSSRSTPALCARGCHAPLGQPAGRAVHD